MMACVVDILASDDVVNDDEDGGGIFVILSRAHLESVVVGAPANLFYDERREEKREFVRRRDERI